MFKVLTNSKLKAEGKPKLNLTCQQRSETVWNQIKEVELKQEAHKASVKMQQD